LKSSTHYSFFQYSGNASDNLDDSEPEQETAHSTVQDGRTDSQTNGKKRKLTKATEAKLKAKEKKKRGVKDSNDDYMDEDEDAYTAPSRIMRDAANVDTGPKPAPGSFETCVKCEKRFTAVCEIPYIVTLFLANEP
jgi:DNA repair protein RAD7